MRLADDYEYESEEEKKSKVVKRLIKKSHLKNQQQLMRKNLMNLINKEENNRNSELFRKHFSFQRPSEILKAVYTPNNRMKNEKLVNVVKSGLSDLKNEIEEISDDEIEIEKPDKIADIVEKIIEFNRQNREGQGLKPIVPGIHPPV